MQSLLIATKEAQEFLKKPYRQLFWFLPSVKKSYQTFKDFQSFMEKLVHDVRQPFLWSLLPLHRPCPSSYFFPIG